jgi:hypothetical protein
MTTNNAHDDWEANIIAEFEKARNDLNQLQQRSNFTAKTSDQLKQAKDSLRRIVKKIEERINVVSKGL